MQDGGASQQDQIMQIIQMFAEIQGMSVDEIMQQLQQMPPEQQQQAIQQMMQVVQQAMQEQQGMQQQGAPQMMAPEEQAMMAQGGSWYYGGYMNHPMMEPNGYQHSVVLHRMGGSAGNMYADGGGIKIDPRKKGTFKAQASKMGMSVQEAASHILRNKDKYSPTMVKKANFARNFAKEFGGQLDEQDLIELY
jgi:DNA-binding transcriptional MerR regulator